MNECRLCGFYDADLECCECPDLYMWYACPIYSQTPEGKAAMDEYIKYLQEHDCRN